MSRKYKLVLEDTSPSEMKRFEVWMVGVLKETYEHKKNQALLNQYAKSLSTTNSDTSVEETFPDLKTKEKLPSKNPLIDVLNWIKKNLNKKNITLKKDTIPSITYLKLFKGTLKEHTINCRSTKSEAKVNLKDLFFDIRDKDGHLSFTLTIKDDKGKKVFWFGSSSYYGILAIVKHIDFDINTFNTKIITIAKQLFLKAGNDENKLDILYERMPAFIIAMVRKDVTLKKDINSLLEDYFRTSGTNEDKGILNILNALKIKDGSSLYKWLESNPLKVLEIYDTAKSIRNEFLKFIHELAITYGNKGYTEHYKAYVSSKDSFILKDIYLNTKRLESGCIQVDSVKGTNWKEFWKELKEEYIDLEPRFREQVNLLAMPISRGNPMHLASLTTQGETVEKFVEKTETVLMLLHLSEQEKDKQFWELVSLTTSIVGTASALRVIALGGSKLAVTLAYVEVTKEAAEIAMLNSNAKQVLKNNNLGWLVDNWTKISIAVDITTFGLDGLINLVKNGKKGVKVLKDANYTSEAKKLQKKVDKAQKIVNEIRDQYLQLETKLAKISKKTDDAFGNFEEVEAIEDIIRKQKTEFGMFFDNKGNVLGGIITGGDGSIEIGKGLTKAKKAIRDKGGKFTDVVFTHNHYGNSALSPSDILFAIENNIKEVRAVGSSGIDYSLKRVKPYPNSENLNNILLIVNKKMKANYPKLHPTKYQNGGGNIEMAQFYAETLLTEFGSYIEYTKFIK